MAKFDIQSINYVTSGTTEKLINIDLDDKKNISLVANIDANDYQMDNSLSNKNNIASLKTSEGQIIHALYDIKDMCIKSNMKNTQNGIQDNTESSDDYVGIYAPSLSVDVLGFCQLGDYAYCMTNSINQNPMITSTNLADLRLTEKASNVKSTNYTDKILDTTINSYIYKSPTELLPSISSHFIPNFNMKNIPYNYIFEVIQSNTVNNDYKSGDILGDVVVCKNAYDYSYSMSMPNQNTLSSARDYIGLGVCGDKIFLKFHDDKAFTGNMSTTVSGDVDMVEIPQQTYSHQKIEVLDSINRFKTNMKHKSNMFSIDIKNTNIESLENDTDPDVQTLYKQIKLDISNNIRQITKKICPANTELFDIRYSGQQFEYNTNITYRHTLTSDQLNYETQKITIDGGTYFIYWGDGTSDTYTDGGVKTHTFNSAGTYDVSIMSFENNITGLTSSPKAWRSETFTFTVKRFESQSLTTLDSAFYTCRGLTGTIPDISKCSNLTNIKNVFQYCSNLTGTIPDISKCTKLIDISVSFQECSKLTGEIPDITKCPNITTLAGIFKKTPNITGTIPDLSKLTKLTDINSAFYGCNNLTGTIPDISKCVNLKSIAGTFWGCSNLTGTIPDISKCVNLEKIASAFYNCSGLTGNIPDLSKCTKLISLAEVFGGCSGLTGAIPDISKCLEISSLSTAFNGCIGLTGTIPDISKCTKLVRLDYAFKDCFGLTGNIPDLSKCTKLTDIRYAFSGCFGLTGEIPDISKCSNISALPYTFYNCKEVTSANATLVGKVSSDVTIAETWKKLTLTQDFVGGDVDTSIRELFPISWGGVVPNPSIILTYSHTLTDTQLNYTTQDIGLSAGGEFSIDWGDGSVDKYTTGGGVKRHTFAEAGTYDVNIIDSDFNVTSINTAPKAWQSPDFVFRIKKLKSPNLTSLNSTFNSCSGLTGKIPDLSQCTKLTSLNSTFNSCSGLTGKIPDLSKCTELTSLNSTFSGCSGLTGSIPDLSKCTELIDMTSAFSVDRGLTGSIPDLSQCPNITKLTYAFSGCSGLTGSIPDISKCTKLTDMRYAFVNCSGLTGSIPDISKCIELTNIEWAFNNCFGLTGNIPDLSKCTKLERLGFAFKSCSGLTGVDEDFANILSTEPDVYKIFPSVKNSSGFNRFICGLNPNVRKIFPIEMWGIKSPALFVYKHTLTDTQLNYETQKIILDDVVGVDNEFMIDWGDASRDTYTDGGVKTHTFNLAGTYYISIMDYGPKITGLAISYNTPNSTLWQSQDFKFSIIELTSPYLQQLISTFSNCKGLNGELPKFETPALRNTMNSFYGCTGLTGNIPDMSQCNNLQVIAYTFFNCSGLTGVNETFASTLSSSESLARLYPKVVMATNFAGNCQPEVLAQIPQSWGGTRVIS